MCFGALSLFKETFSNNCVACAPYFVEDYMTAIGTFARLLYYRMLINVLLCRLEKCKTGSAVGRERKQNKTPPGNSSKRLVILQFLCVSKKSVLIFSLLFILFLLCKTHFSFAHC